MNAVPEPRRLKGLDWSDDGRATLSGELLEWSIALDTVVRDRALALGATEYRFPSLIPARALAPVAYLRSFPQLATFAVAPKRADLPQFAAEHGVAHEIPVSADRFVDASYLLTPAACYHFYPAFSGREISEPLLLTTRCQCHRCEDHYEPLRRQWAFEMREVVCIGDRESIAHFAERWCNEVGKLRRHLGIAAAWQTASDPFFDPAGDPKALAQLLEPGKEELVTPCGLAIASVNLHRSFFGESYGIRAGGAPAQSACVAFGIERWLDAMQNAHGSRGSDWPAPAGFEGGEHQWRL